MKKFTQYLKCEFSATEIADKAKELATANRKRGSIEQQKKEIDADLKGKVEAQNSIIGRLSEQIMTGSEYRDVDCTIVMDSPAIGQKTIIRNDTGEEVKVELMTDEDKQLALDLQGKADEQDDAAEAAKEPIITPAPFISRIEAAGRVPKSHRLDAGPDSWTDFGGDPKEPR